MALFGDIFNYALELTAEKRRNPTDDIWSTLDHRRGHRRKWRRALHPRQ